MSETETQEVTNDANALCAFTVVVDGDGVPRIFGQGVEGVKPFREPTALDIRRAVLELASDYQARAAADYVVESLAATAAPDVSERVQAALDKATESD